MPALKYIISVDIQKTRYKKLFTHVDAHTSAVSLLERAENSAVEKRSVIIIFVSFANVVFHRNSHGAATVWFVAVLMENENE